MSQSWYLAVDMQLVWISPIFLFPMLKLKNKVFFWIILVVGVSVSIIVPFILTYYEKLPGTMLYYKGLVFLKFFSYILLNLNLNTISRNVLYRKKQKVKSVSGQNSGGNFSIKENRIGKGITFYLKRILPFVFSVLK